MTRFIVRENESPGPTTEEGVSSTLTHRNLDSYYVNAKTLQ